LPPPFSFFFPKVILACRSIQRGQALQRAIEDEAKASGRADPSLEVMELDLSSLQSVRNFAAAWKTEKNNRPVHILINNAGIFSMSAPRCETEDGFESHIGTNHLGHFLLTLLLMPALRAGANDIHRPARVVNVSSRLNLMGKLHRENPNLTTGYNSLAAYAQSKLAQIAFAAELSQRSDGDVIAVAVHPGEVATDVVRSLHPYIQKLYNIVMGAILLTPAQGARSSVYCGTSPDLDSKPALQNIFYYDSNCAPGTAAKDAYDADARAWLWKWSADAVKLDPKDDLLVNL
jgi:retinol dehydrogenase-12